MKVGRIVNIIQTYNSYYKQLKANENALFWELMGTGETEKTQQLRMKIKLDEDKFEKFKNEEV